MSRNPLMLAARNQTETPEFKSWFGDSMVVDPSGRPLVVYHGSDAPPEQFAEAGTGRNGAEFGRGIYVTDNPAYAEKFGQAIMPLYVSAERIVDEAEIPERLQGEAAKQWAIKSGYDAIRSFKGVFGGAPARQIVVFRPEQIKSAVGNCGAFWPASPSICMSRVLREREWGSFPRIKFERLHHVGTFDRAQKATTHNRCSLEGNGLSVSKHPEAWRKIARLGDCPVWSIQAKQAPIALIDAHAMSEQQWARVTAWAHACGLIEPTRVIRVSWMDDEMGDTCHMEFDLKQPGKTEKEIENEARLEYEERIDCEGKIEIVDAWQSTPAMDGRIGWSVDSSLSRDMALTLFAQDVAFESDGIAGVWWSDKLDVSCYSAPRGVIHQGALDEFECEVVPRCGAYKPNEAAVEIKRERAR